MFIKSLPNSERKKEPHFPFKIYHLKIIERSCVFFFFFILSKNSFQGFPSSEVFSFNKLIRGRGKKKKLGNDRIMHPDFL